MPDQVICPVPTLPAPAPAPSHLPAPPLAARERPRLLDEDDQDLQLLRAIFDGPLFS